MIKSLLTAVLLISASVNCIAIAGPFGLKMGTPLEKIGGNPTKIKTGYYQLSSVPKPHSAFETYYIQSTPATGLCYVSVSTRNIKTKPDGIGLKAAFYNMLNKYEKIYGKASNVRDNLKLSSPLNAPGEWMIGLFLLDRHLFAEWDVKGENSLKNGVSNITIEPITTSQRSGFIHIRYSFLNKDDCVDELVEQKMQGKDKPIEINPIEDSFL